MRTVSEACLPSPADRPRYFTVGSSEQSGQLLILPPAVRFAKEWGLKDPPQIIQSRIHPREGDGFIMIRASVALRSFKAQI